MDKPTRSLSERSEFTGASGDRSRRDFLGRAAAVPAAMIISQDPAGQPAGHGATAPLPQILFGKYSMSRLICGANPFNAGSHLSTFVNREMGAYFTPEQILKTLRRCQEAGINFWQSAGDNDRLYQRFIAEGGQMHYISLGFDRAEIPRLVRSGCVGIAHHGEFTDQHFKSGQLDKIHEYLKQVRDAGLMVGVSTHIPAVVDAVEAKGWDVDFYMTCVYERHRSASELKSLLGYVPIPVGEVYLQEDPPRMFKTMRQTQRPCLAFKILAAGRLSERKEWVEKAFRMCFQSIKPNDGVIVGIYDRYTDQVAEDTEYTRRFSALSATT